MIRTVGMIVSVRGRAGVRAPHSGDDEGGGGGGEREGSLEQQCVKFPRQTDHK